MKKPCAVCDKGYGFNLLWEIEKIWLRLTEVSLLWENCCSEKCYELLLTNLLNGQWDIEKDANGNAILRKEQVK